MIKENLVYNQQIKLQQSCCSNSSCCNSKNSNIQTIPKVGRNNPCPCESGLKFKKCCGK